eukprot:TRINITY_DN15252_c0_g1_i1.p1 TRINITY_DN15252_c0_g1~~TRINITY_DN15252_c0_g1_i1.p1  ORF type:complete len:195 (+),score=36.37 TRINITY_DN15252_c0_g1_i1:107-691(+)
MDAQAMHRANTTDIREGAQMFSRVFMCIGIVVLIVQGAVAAVYIHYSTVIPDTCNSDMQTVFLANGIITCAMGIVMALGICAAKEMFAAKSHQALLEKWANESHDPEEIEEEQEAFESDQRCAMGLGGTACCALCVLLPASMGFQVYGIIQAAAGDNDKCGGAVNVFWVLMAIQFLTNFTQSCGKSGAGYSSQS